MPDVHAHRWRRSFAHEWKLAGGDTADLMVLLGWLSEDMPRRYGASAAAERAMETQQRIGIAERTLLTFRRRRRSSLVGPWERPCPARHGRSWGRNNGSRR